MHLTRDWPILKKGLDKSIDMTENIPNVIVITGAPGSGKTTLAHKLSNEIGCPVISRDEIKAGYVVTQNKSHDELGSGVNAEVSKMFFDLVDKYLSYGVTIAIEAAFQHKVWAPRLNGIKKVAHIKLIICDVDPLVAFERRQQRLRENPDREKFHGEKKKVTAGDASSLETYTPPSVDFPTLWVNTTNEYDPAFEMILKFIGENNHQ